MTCQDVADRDLAEAYLFDRLSEEERDAFERHYFECERCFAEVEALRDVQGALRRPVAGPAQRAANWSWLATAALVILGVAAIALVWRGARSTDQELPVASREAATPASPSPSQPAPRIDAQLARVEPPRYEPRRLRTAGLRPAFVAGMNRYQAADYAGAIPSLQEAVAADRAFEPARFYLGVSQILVGQPQAGIRTLEPIAARRDSPFAEEARFVTAKGHLQLGDVAQAARALDRTIELQGEREAEARRIKAALPPTP